VLVEGRGRDPLNAADPLRAALAVSSWRLDQRATEAEVERPAAGKAKSDEAWDIAVDVGVAEAEAHGFSEMLLSTAILYSI
jgi:hypothetical protein